MEVKCDTGQVSRDRKAVKREERFSQKRWVCVKVQRQKMNLGRSQAGGQHGGKGYKGTTGGAGLTAPWQAGAGSLGPPELTTPLCTSVASSIEPPHPSTCSHGATVRITRLDAGKGLRPVSGTPLSAAGRKWPQDTKPTPAALQKQQGDQKKSQGSTQGRLKVAE